MENNITPKIIGWPQSVSDSLDTFKKQVSISIDTLDTKTLNPNDFNIFLHFEPKVISPIDDDDEIIRLGNYYDLILTWDKRILDSCSNSKLFPFGDCWIDEKDRNIHQKTKQLSIIASHKRQTDGHKLRHNVISRYPMDVYGNGYKRIENKITALKDYRFTIVIENTKQEFWFTEKLIDSFVTGTVPIYWGFDSVGDFFNKDGMLIFNNIEELDNILNSLSTELYESKMDEIKDNFNKALVYSTIWGRLNDEINKYI